MNKFRQYVDFKENHPYAEKDPDYEPSHSPKLSKQNSSYIDKYESKAS